MIDFNKEEQELKNILERFEQELKRLRTGRASLAIFESINIDIYSSSVPLTHIASISLSDARSAVIKPWDKNNLPAIEQALSKSNLGVSVISEKDQVRAFFPILTEERRQEFLKIAKKKTEETRILIRRKRDDIWKTIQEEEKSKLISENQKFKEKEKMEKLIEEINRTIENMVGKKEKEIMTI